MLASKARLAALLVALVGLVAAPAAQASDAGLRKVVKRQEAKVAPLAKAFAEADKAVQSAEDLPAAAQAAADFRKGLAGYKKAITPIKTQSTKSKQGKKLLLTAIREFDLGLVEYNNLIGKAGTDPSNAEIKASLKTINKRIAEAAEDETDALALLGFKTEGS